MEHTDSFTYLGNVVYINDSYDIDFGVVCFDKSKSIYMYSDKPIKEDAIWYLGRTMSLFRICELKDRFITNVNWEDSMRFYVRKNGSFVEVSEEEFNLVKAILNQ